MPGETLETAAASRATSANRPGEPNATDMCSCGDGYGSASLGPSGICPIVDWRVVRGISPIVDFGLRPISAILHSMERQRCDKLRPWAIAYLELPRWKWHWAACSPRIANGAGRTCTPDAHVRAWMGLQSNEGALAETLRWSAKTVTERGEQVESQSDRPPWSRSGRRED